MDKIFLIEIKKPYSMRAHMMRKDAQATIWEKIFANHTTNKVLETRIYSELSKLFN